MLPLFGLVLVATLFGDSDRDTAALVLLSNLVGGAVVYAIGKIQEWRAKNRDNSIADETRKNVNLQSLVERLDRERAEREVSYQKERAEWREEIRKLDNEVEELSRKAMAAEATAERAKIRSERAVFWIRHLEVLLDAAKQPHTKWTETPDGSGEHAPLGGNQ